MIMSSGWFEFKQDTAAAEGSYFHLVATPPDIISHISLGSRITQGPIESIYVYQQQKFIEMNMLMLIRVTGFWQCLQTTIKRGSRWRGDEDADEQ
jgi:hypothetical protein